MSNQEIAKNMIDRLPEDKIIYIINILENIGEMYGINIYPEYKPNNETIQAVQEVNTMIQEGTGEHFEGATTDFFAEILGE